MVNTPKSRDEEAGELAEAEVEQLLALRMADTWTGQSRLLRSELASLGLLILEPLAKVVRPLMAKFDETAARVLISRKE